MAWTNWQRASSSAQTLLNWQEAPQHTLSLAMRLRHHNAGKHGRAGQAPSAYCGEDQRKEGPRRHAESDKENIAKQRNIPADLELLEVWPLNDLPQKMQ